MASPSRFLLMIQAPTVVVSVLLAAAAAAGITFSMRSAADPAPNDAGAEALREIAELRKQYSELQKKCEALANAPAPATAPVAADRVAVPMVSAEQVAAAVDAYLLKRAAGTGALGASSETAPFELETTFSELAGTNYWDNSAAWKKAFESGHIDEIVAKFEAAAKANPNDVKVQMQLANAYMANLQMDQSKWQLSMKADKVFDTVLELEPTHWEARFTKAVSYTFYPDFLGKKKDAIKNFETLVEQQESQPVQAHQAQTYLYLGNLLEARDPAKAKEMWARGARRHPDNAELVKKAGG